MYHPEEFDLQRGLRAVWASRHWVAAATVACGVAAFVFSRYVMEPVYKASSVLLVRGDNSGNPLASLASSVGGTLPGAISLDSGNPRQEAVAILKSRTLARMVVRELGLQQAYRSPSEAEAIQTLSDNVRVQTGRENQISIVAAAATPALAAEIANALARNLERYQQREESSTARRHLRFVERLLERARRDLRRAEEALRSFQERNHVVAIDLDAQETVKRAAQVQTELAAARVLLRETRQRLDALRPRLVRRVQNEAAPPIANSNEVERLRGKLADLQSELVVAERAYTDEHPRVRELRMQAAEVKRQLRDYQAKALEATYEGVVPELIDLEVTAIATQVREQALQRELDRLRQATDRLPSVSLQYARLRREVEVQDELCRALTRKWHEARIAAERSLLPVVVLDPAEPPLRKSAPRVKLITLLGLCFGFAGAALAALLRDWVHTAETGSPPDRETTGRASDRVPARDWESPSRR